jgi:hypothetical protein
MLAPAVSVPVKEVTVTFSKLPAVVTIDPPFYTVTVLAPVPSLTIAGTAIVPPSATT